MKLLVTGGAGYIGSHFVRQYLETGNKIVVLDNLSRGHKEAVPQNVNLEIVDLANYEDTLAVFAKHNIESVVHFAAYAYVGESVEDPELYYSNNVVGSMNLLKAVKEFGIKKFVFSSTCSLYGNPLKIPIPEEEEPKPINPYAHGKLFIEDLLRNYDSAYGLQFVSLRYFNAAGADPSCEIGSSHDPETRIIPITLQAALDKSLKVSVFGNDYNTHDGTCVRDYIHVNDLAEGHVKAMQYLNNGGNSTTLNLGTGKGSSVLEIIETAKKVTGKEIDFEIVDVRPGDPEALVANNKKAGKMLGWEPKHNLDDIITTAWNWLQNKKY